MNRPQTYTRSSFYVGGIKGTLVFDHSLHFKGLNEQPKVSKPILVTYLNHTPICRKGIVYNRIPVQETWGA